MYIYIYHLYTSTQSKTLFLHCIGKDFQSITIPSDCANCKFPARPFGTVDPMVPPSLRLVSFLKAETFERGQHIIKEGEVHPFTSSPLQRPGGMLNDLWTGDKFGGHISFPDPRWDPKHASLSMCHVACILTYFWDSSACSQKFHHDDHESWWYC